MVDIAPGLLEKIERAFNETINNSVRLRELADELTYGSGQYGEAEELACIVGDALSDAIRECLSEDVLPDGRLYENIAQKIIPPSLRRNYDIISEYARKAQENVNRVGGIGIKPIVPEYSVDREQGIIRHAVNGKTYDAHARSFLDEVVTFGQKVVDDSIQQNAGFQYRAGLGAKITRTVHGKACKWCMNLAGLYDYGDMPGDIFRRHANCRCVVEYKVGKWSQNVHTKRYYDENGNAVDARKVVGLSKTWQKPVDGGTMFRMDGDKSKTPEERVRNLPKGENVTAEYIRNSMPAKGKFVKADEFVEKAHENEIGEWIYKIFGGDITLLAETNPQGEKNPDYLWNGKLWDLKTVSSEKAANSAIRSGLKQIRKNPGGVILNYNKQVNSNLLIDVIEERMKWSRLDRVDIMVKQNERYFILRYEK